VDGRAECTGAWEAGAGGAVFVGGSDGGGAAGIGGRMCCRRGCAHSGVPLEQELGGWRDSAVVGIGAAMPRSGMHWGGAGGDAGARMANASDCDLSGGGACELGRGDARDVVGHGVRGGGGHINGAVISGWCDARQRYWVGEAW